MIYGGLVLNPHILNSMLPLQASGSATSNLAPSIH